MVGAVFAMVLCVLCWSSGGLLIKQTDWHPMVISCVRSMIAAAFMAAVQGKGMFTRPAKPEGTPKLFAINAFMVAALASAATKVLYVTANKMTSPVNAILLQHASPVWTALAAGFLIRERLCRAQWLAVFLSVCGIFVFFLGGLGSVTLAGDGIALLSGVSFALSMLALRALKDASPARALFFSHLITAAIGFPFVFTAPPALTAGNIARVAFLGLVQIGAASLLYAYAIKRLPAINAMLIAQFEPVLNPLWLIVFLGELPTPYALAGGTVIIGAVVISSIGKKGGTLPCSGSAAPRFFPLFLPIAGKRVLIVGGGNIALRRVQTLLPFDCRIHVVAEKVRDELEKIAGETPALTIERRAFSPGDCAHGERPLFVIAATNNRAVNHAVSKECAELGLPVSVADRKEESTFYFPAVAIHDTLVAGLSSGGSDHGAVRDAAKTIREALKK